MITAWVFSPWAQFSFEFANQNFSLGPQINEAHAATCGTNGTYNANDNGRESCTYTTAGADTFTPPTNVTSIHVAAWGAGGGGFDGSSSGGGKGGGGGAFASTTITVVPGTPYDLTVGDGGTENTDGTDSLFNTDDIIADGGAGGTSATTGGGTGGSLANTSCNGVDCDVEYAGGTGGNGSNGSSSDDGGGGGGAAGPHGDGGNGAAGTTSGGGGGGGGNGGNDATNGTGASSANGGAGGNGSGTGNGSPGTSHANGGGGGGGGDDGDAGGNGGAPGGGGGGGEVCNNGTECQGADGQIYISWETPAIPPTINIDQPDGVSDTVEAGQNYTVQYDLADSDSTVTADFFYTTSSGAETVIALTAGSTWVVPDDWNSATNTIEVIGGGGGGDSAGGADAGGGGGAYAKKDNVVLTPGATVTIAIGSGGPAGSPATSGGDTYVCDSTSNCASISGTAVVVGAKGGGGASGQTQGSGGAAGSSKGDVTYSGGDGGAGVNWGGSGGGGAAGPNGDGAAGSTAFSGGQGAGGGGGSGGGTAGSPGSTNNGGAGGNNDAGSGSGAGGTSGSQAGSSGSNGGGGGGGYGGATNGAGGDGGDGVEWYDGESFYGAGGGGGGSGDANPTAAANGGDGGLYGGGGGGSGEDSGSAGGAGAQGIIIIRYTPGVAMSGCQDQAEGTNATCAWDTTGVGAGSYYIYGMTTDGTATSTAFSSGQVTINAAQAGATISGTLYSDEGTTAVTSGETISLYMATSTNSVATSTTSDGSGNYSFAGLEFPTEGTPFVIWVGDNSSFRASAVASATTTSGTIPNMHLYQNRVAFWDTASSTTGVAATSTTITMLNLYDNDNDDDIQFKTDGSTLDILAGNMLYIGPGTTFTPGGAVTIHGNAQANDTDGSIRLAYGTGSEGVATSSLLQMDGNALSLAGSWFASTTAIVKTSGTVTFTATTTGKLIYASSTPFYNLTFDGVDGTTGGWTFQEMASTTNNFTITDGTVVAPSWLSIGGNYTNNGTFTSGTGTTTFNGTAAQTISGTLVESSALANVEINNTFAGGVSEDWYNSDWLYRKKITLKQASSTLSNFPVLVSLSDTDLAARAQADGDDILFTSSDGTTKIPHEIEASSTIMLIRVNSSSDDAEEWLADNSVYIDSSDLELIDDGGDQQVGMVFDGVSIPQGSVIRSAYIQFTTDETSSGATSLTIYGEDTDNAGTFTTATSNISGRTKTTASVAWDNIPAWDTLQENGSDQATPDLSPILKEIVDRPGWSQGNSMGFIITGSGSRTAEAYDGSTTEAPLLVVEWEDPHDGGIDAWVNVPTLSSSGPTDIYMYYGNSATSSEEMPASVWDSNYVAVYHFSDEPTGLDEWAYTDSSGNEHWGWDVVADGNSKEGKVGRGQGFGRSTAANDDWIGSSEHSDFAFAAGDHAFEGWFKADEQVSSSGFGVLYGRFTGGTPGAGYFIGIRDSNSNLELDYRADGGDSLSLSSRDSIHDNFEDGNWHYFAISIDVSEKLGTLYIDGNWHDDDTYTGNLIDKTGYPESAFFMSAIGWDSPGQHELLGSMDEVRFTKGSARTDDWFSITYDNATATSTFYSSIGSEETNSGGSGVGVTFSNSASTTNFMIMDGGVQAPPYLYISGNFDNQANFDANSGTTTFNGTSQQYISGFATGTNAFAGLEILNTTASTTFTAAASSTGMMTALAGARIEFKSGATTTVQNISLNGSGGNEIYLHPSTPAEEGGWDLSNASNDNITYDITGQGGTGTVSTGIAFKSDGTKMYQVEAGTDSVYQYSLSTPWDVSTLSYDTVSFSVTDQDKNPSDIAFSSDGTKMFIVGPDADRVYEYLLASPWDLSTASYNNASTSVSQAPTARGLAFKTDGTELYIAGAGGTDRVFQYSLSSPWDITSASYNNASTSISSTVPSPQAIAFKSDGTMFFAVGDLNDEIGQYSLSSAWDITTASHEILLDVNPPESTPWGLAFKPDGTKMFLLGQTNNDTVYQYSLTGSQWGLEVPGARSVSYVNVKDSNACYTSGNNMSAVNSTDGGNNDCWDISAPVAAGTLAISDHDTGQESNKFNTNSLIDEEFFRFKLIPSSEAITISLVFSLTTFGVSQSDITNVQLFPDYNGDGNINGDDSEDPVGGVGTVSIVGNTGTITFSGFSTSTAMNYILQADISSINPGDELSIGLNKAKITASGVSSGQSITPSGTVTLAVHSRSGGGSVGAGGKVGDTSTAQETQTGGGGGGGDQTGEGSSSTITELIFSDSFTGSNGTDLVSHTPDTGTSWTEAIDTAGNLNIQIQSNQARASAFSESNTLAYVANPASTHADMRIEAKFAGLPTSNDDVFKFVVRYQDSNNFYACVFSWDSGNAYAVWFDKTVGGTVTDLTGGATPTIVAGDTVACQIEGTTLKILVNGTTILTDSDTSISTAGKAGMYLGAYHLWPTTDVNTAWVIDDFKVYQAPVQEGGGGGGGGRS